MARPTKYNEEIQKLADEYISMPLFETYKIQKVVRDEVVDVELQRPSGIPSVAGLALKLDVTRKTIYNWGEDESKFLYTLEKLNEKQKDFLLYHGLTHFREIKRKAKRLLVVSWIN